MFRIKTESLSKKFNRHFLFRDFSFEFSSGKSYALTGHNGSGKSTLLQILSGIQLPTTGTISVSNQHQLITETLYQYCSFAAPYSELIEEFTLQEALDFHTRLKPFSNKNQLPLVLEETGLHPHLNKEMKWFSSGMKQRVKLILSLFSESPLLFLDEPTSNMDETGIEWYRNSIDKVKQDKLLIIASNQRSEYDFCHEVIDITKYK
jgi:ABC-type multidrug transport system ATPase subunit